MLAAIPSPPTNGIHLGPLTLHAYGVMIALGILAAVRLAQWEWSRIGGRAGVMASLAVWGVPGGVIGARAYSMVTSWSVNTAGAHGFWGHVWACFEIWHGGLGIWGGVAGGIATGLYGARRMGLPFAPLLDCVAAAFPVAQAIGRVGNYFNQELYGWRSNLPWAVRIDHPTVSNAGQIYPAGTTFQPTFLYEGLWDLLTAVIVLWVGRRFRIRRGYLLAVYAATYTFGRFFTEYMRIDPAHRYLGLRLNDWTSIAVFAAAIVVLLVRGLHPAGDDLARSPLSTHLQGTALAVATGTTPGDGDGHEERTGGGTPVPVDTGG